MKLLNLIIVSIYIILLRFINMLEIYQSHVPKKIKTEKNKDKYSIAVYETKTQLANGIFRSIQKNLCWVHLESKYSMRKKREENKSDMTNSINITTKEEKLKWIEKQIVHSKHRVSKNSSRTDYTDDKRMKDPRFPTPTWGLKKVSIIAWINRKGESFYTNFSFSIFFGVNK